MGKISHFAFCQRLAYTHTQSNNTPIHKLLIPFLPNESDVYTTRTSMPHLFGMGRSAIARGHDEVENELRLERFCLCGLARVDVAAAPSSIT
jgi:hypothetical protein